MQISNIDFIEISPEHNNVNHFGGIIGGTNGISDAFSIYIGGLAIAIGDLRAITLVRGAARVFTLSSFGY